MQLSTLIAAEAGAAFTMDPQPATGVAALAWLVPLLPLVGSAVLLLTGRRWRRWGDAAGWFATAMVAGSFAVSLAILAQLLAADGEQRTLLVDLYTWIDVGGLQLTTDLLLDPLSVTMLMVVTGVGALIHVYSVGYMHGDERYSRYFAYLNLFVFSMLVLVLGANLVTLFVGWELVGLCSYLLIGFWFEEISNAVAAKKAMVVNRIGDASFAVGIFLVFVAFGSLAFDDVLPRAAEVLSGREAFATAIGLLLFGGATGKSAQIPLYVWLPDAMAGPTPVSALIHAATMVTAGVYMVARLSPVYVHAPLALTVVAVVGVATALLAAIIAVQQDDLKKVLAYSTVSQLGYMFVGVGVGVYAAGVFHLFTHAFFKALLFLAAGSVMHAMANRTDMWQMGGLRALMPATYWTSVAAWLAISGIFPFAGFFSKDQILEAAWHHGFQGVYAVGLVTAGVTAFYMSRWLFVTFLGQRRWRAGAPVGAGHGGSAEAEPDTHAASDTTGHGTAPASEHAGHELHPHESPWTMTVPLVLLGVASLAAGWLNPVDEGPFHQWLEPAVAGSPFATVAGPSVLVFAAISMAVALVGIGAAAALYLRPAPARDPLPVRLGAVATALRRRFWVDEAYELAFVSGGTLLANFLVWFDATVIDGTVDGVGRTTRVTAARLRTVQVGLVRAYLAGIAIGTVVLVAAFLLQFG